MISTEASEKIRKRATDGDRGDAKGKKPRGYWTVERSLEEARKYKSRNEFAKSSSQAYQVLLKNGLLHKIHFDSDEKRKPMGYWTIERSLEEAKKYRTRTELRENSWRAYDVLWKAGLLERCGFELGRKPNGYYTKERCLEIARGFKTRSDLQRGCYRAYDFIRENDLWAEVPWIEPPKNLNSDGWCLYTYEFPDGCVYVGITMNPKDRDAAHRGLRKRKVSAVYRHHLETGLQVPEMNVVLRGLSAKEASGKEREFVRMYENDRSKTVLNKAKPGSLGNAYRKWTSDKVIEAEARKYRTAFEFRKGSSGAYEAARKRGLLRKFDFFEDGRKIYIESTRMARYEECLAAARKYDTPKKFEKSEPNLYASALRHRWLGDYTWMRRVKHEKWTRESILEHVRERGYRTLAEFWKDKSVYETSRKLGMSAEDLGLERKRGRVWTFEDCRKIGLEDGSRRNFHNNHSSGYFSALEHGWLDRIFGPSKRKARNPPGEGNQASPKEQ